jgi:hypothetical protein
MQDKSFCTNEPLNTTVIRVLLKAVKENASWSAFFPIGPKVRWLLLLDGVQRHMNCISLKRPRCPGAVQHSCRSCQWFAAK